MVLRQRQYQGGELTTQGEGRGLMNWLKTSPVAHVGGGALLAVVVLRVLR